uniref:Pre-rRNA-processing protein Ipi1 N-terminal domain-containing protein n=1 Tax=Electrophorus electricus TaxID=8005 RepID=A0AAY5F3J3_ELEEL
MTKKRKRQDDFHKVKLKVGKKKPKVENATNVNFRSKRIHLPEQLNRDDGGPTTHRQLSIKDLLSQLHHYNSTVKQDALQGLRELLASHPYLVEQQASTVLPEVAALFTDKDGGVRVAATRLLRFLAQCIPAEHVAPFFPLLSAHLTCAMTHIAPGIQEDALRVLDVLLEHYPALLSQRHAVLLANFLELISQRRMGGAGGGARGGAGGDKGAGKGSYALSISTSRSVTAQQWRLTVLLRLSRFLQAVVEERPTEDRAEGAGFLSVWGGEKAVVTPLEVTWEEQACRTGAVRVFENSGAKPTPHSTYRLRPETEPGAGVSEGLCSAETVQGFAETLVPLLLEVWVEAMGGDRAPSDSGHLLSEEAMALMFQILTILQLLRRLAPHRDQQDMLDAWFRNSYLNEFKQHFMKNFPYCQLEIARHKKKTDAKRQQVVGGAAASGNVEPLALNVMLCQVMVSLSLRGRGHVTGQDADWLGPIRAFVTDTLSNGGKLGSKQLAALLEVVWRMIITQQSRLVTEELLQAVYIQYQQRNLGLPVRTLLLRFFSQLYIQEHQNHPHIARSRMLARWLASVPVQLVQLGSRNPQLSAQLLQTVQSAAAWGNNDVLRNLQAHACNIYDPQEGCIVVLPAELQQHLVQILYFMPAFPADVLACLSHACNTGRVSASLATALIRTVHLRSPLSGWSSSSHDVPVRDVDYLSFLFSTLTGTHPPPPPPPPHPPHTHTQAYIAGGLLAAISMTTVNLTPCVRIILGFQLYNLTWGGGGGGFLLFIVVCVGGGAHRDAVWEACFAALSTVPRLLRLLLQSLRVCDLCEEELPLLAQLLSLLLQHTQLRNHMAANNALLQTIIQDLTVAHTRTRLAWFIITTPTFSQSR